jgi:hypothetical protein
MKFLKENSYDPPETQITNHSKTQEGFIETILQVIFSNHLDFKTLSSIQTMVFLQNPRSRIK